MVDGPSSYPSTKYNLFISANLLLSTSANYFFERFKLMLNEQCIIYPDLAGYCILEAQEVFIYQINTSIIALTPQCNATLFLTISYFNLWMSYLALPPFKTYSISFRGRKRHLRSILITLLILHLRRHYKLPHTCSQFEK